MRDELNIELAKLQIELAALRKRVEQVEGEITSALFDIQSGLRGTDGGAMGFYEQVRNVEAAQTLLEKRVAELHLLVSQHELDRNRIIGSTRALYWFIALLSGFVSWVVSLLAK